MRYASTEYCLLCNRVGEVFYKDKKQLYLKCTRCSAIFMSGAILPDREAEKLRYMEHNNDVNDPGYRKFVSPITSAIMSRFTPGHKGLDFGAGTGPVISEILQEEGYSIEQYDPFFFNDTALLERKYDYIACCEVIEHFHDPEKEFRLLRRMLLPGGRLFCMTDIYDHTIDFARWYYKNDPTHVFIYQRETLEMIRKEFGFPELAVEGRLVTFSG